MSLRNARFDDQWRKAFSRSYQNRYEQLEFTGLFCLGTGSITFRAGITAVIGGNGVGKSTLASALGELIEVSLEEEYLSKRTQLSGSDLRATLQEGAHQKTRSAHGGNIDPRSVTGDDLVTESWWLDPSYWSLQTRRQVLKDANFQDLLESVTPALLAESDLLAASYVVGKEYESCSVFEIADYADFIRFPYFRVRSGGVEYGSEHMGQGELSLMMTLWVLRDLRPNSILILEEPEAHVSPKSQHALMNVLAEAAARKAIWSIVTTHSPSVVGRLPQEHIRLLTRSGNGISIIQNPHKHQISAVLGEKIGFSGVALVEDETAKEFAISLLDELSPDLVRQIEVVCAGGESEISKALSALPRSGDWFRLIGIFDGDQRGRINAGGHQWPHTLLPGATDPAVLLKEVLSVGANTSVALSTELRRTDVNVSTALSSLTGIDPKDWLIELGRQLLVSKFELVRALTHIWLRTPENKVAAALFLDEVLRCYDA